MPIMPMLESNTWGYYRADNKKPLKVSFGGRYNSKLPKKYDL